MMGIALVACSMFACGDPADEATEYTIKVKANNSDWGTVTGGGKYEEGATATLEATANAGYKFVNWEDNSTNNPRLVTVTADAEYTANFAIQSGVKVQFGETTWNAEQINGTSNSSAYMIAAAQTASSDYPFIAIYSSSLATGTTTSNPTVNIEEQTAVAGDPYLWYFESAERAMNLNNKPTGDWWTDNLTVNVSEFDADALTISLVANGTAKSLYDCLDGQTWETTPSKAISVTASGVSLKSSKVAMPTAFAGKITKR